jgi:Uma2 family endonuclease
MYVQHKPPPAPMTIDEFFAWDGGGHVGKLELVEGVVGPLIPPLGRRINARAPDVVVAAGLAADAPVFENPVLIVEVLSPSNEDDTWETIHTLAGLATLKEILVVRSDRLEAEVYTRDASGAWPRDPVTAGAGGRISLASIGLELPVAEVYAGTYIVGGSGT